MQLADVALAGAAVGAALVLALAVVLAAQAWYVVRTVPKLPPAEGADHGFVAQAERKPGAPARELRVLMLGDSVVEGTGIVGSHEDAFSGHVARALARRLGCDVRWVCAGKSGSTAATLRTEVLPRAKERAAILGRVDLVAMSVGVNDALRGWTSADFAAELSQLVGEVHAAWPDAHITLSGKPAITHFPALPVPLCLALDWRVGRVFGAARRVVEGATSGRGASYAWVALEDALPRPGETAFLADGFHPGGSVLRAIADAITSRAAAAGVMDG